MYSSKALSPVALLGHGYEDLKTKSYPCTLLCNIRKTLSDHLLHFVRNLRLGLEVDDDYERYHRALPQRTPVSKFSPSLDDVCLGFEYLQSVGFSFPKDDTHRKARIHLPSGADVRRARALFAAVLTPTLHSSKDRLKRIHFLKRKVLTIRQTTTGGHKAIELERPSKYPPSIFEDDLHAFSGELNVGWKRMRDLELDDSAPVTKEPSHHDFKNDANFCEVGAYERSN